MVPREGAAIPDLQRVFPGASEETIALVYRNCDRDVERAAVTLKAMLEEGGEGDSKEGGENREEDTNAVGGLVVGRLMRFLHGGASRDGGSMLASCTRPRWRALWEVVASTMNLDGGVSGGELLHLQVLMEAQPAVVLTLLLFLQIHLYGLSEAQFYAQPDEEDGHGGGEGGSSVHGGGGGGGGGGGSNPLTTQHLMLATELSAMVPFLQSVLVHLSAPVIRQDGEDGGTGRSEGGGGGENPMGEEKMGGGGGRVVAGGALKGVGRSNGLAAPTRLVASLLLSHLIARHQARPWVRNTSSVGSDLQVRYNGGTWRYEIRQRGGTSRIPP
jgi:hypothetical protein